MDGTSYDKRGLLARIVNSSYTATILLGHVVLLWGLKVQAIVPEPYLDEFFHVRQAKVYIEQGRWDIWDPKITTPPGLYLISYLQFFISKALGLWSGNVAAHSLRWVNLCAGMLLMREARKLLKLINAERAGQDRSPAEAKEAPDSLQLNLAIGNIFLFPPLFFFYGLYYTDVISALLVLATYRFHLKKQKFHLVLAGLASLLFRQTNIFWIFVFLGGLEVSRTMVKGMPGTVFAGPPTFWDVLTNSWHYSSVYNPLASQAFFEDYIKTGVSIAVAGLTNFSAILRAMIPYLLFLSTFVTFIEWNGGVVLGDKENHVASIHLSQMLYIWPYFTFFSLPLLHTYISNSVIPHSLLPAALRSSSTKEQLPRLIVALPIMATMSTIVYFNTIVHPFTLADNRHYMFYVFRLLLRHPVIKYLAVPVYFVCAWASITALGGLPIVQPPSEPKTILKTDPEQNIRSSVHPTTTKAAQGNRVSFILIWLLTTTLSLVTAPLVEPRYFILPWLMWRLHVPIPDPHPLSPSIPLPSRVRREDTTSLAWFAEAKMMIYDECDHRLWLEMAWFLAVNFGTGYVFLYWGFEWPQEPGVVQRFMW